jgi:iron-sulfur cluster repair protein YtfE (RIC family)
MTTIFDLLEKDHGKVKSLIADALDANGSERGKLFNEIKHDLELHTSFEEEYFYPEARATTGMDEEVEDDLHEHREAKQLLEKLSGLDPSSSQWTDSMKELQSALAHHIEDEEEKLFPQARQKVHLTRAQELGARYEQMKSGG